MNSYIMYLIPWTALNSQGTRSCGALECSFHEILWLSSTTCLCGHLHLHKNTARCCVITGQQNPGATSQWWKEKQGIEKVSVWNVVWKGNVLIYSLRHRFLLGCSQIPLPAADYRGDAFLRKLDLEMLRESQCVVCTFWQNYSALIVTVTTTYALNWEFTVLKIPSFTCGPGKCNFIRNSFILCFCLLIKKLTRNKLRLSVPNTAHWSSLLTRFYI